MARRYSWILLLWIALIHASLGDDPVGTVAAQVKGDEGGDVAAPTTAAAAATVPAVVEVPGPIKLTARNFDTTLSTGRPWLLEFYAPWCSHCTSFATAYSEMARKYHGSKQGEHQYSNIKVGKVDGSAETALSSRFSVYGYPSFYMIDGWSVYKFEDTRSKQNLMAFAEGGYKKQDPLPFYQSPMGPVGIAQAVLMFAGIRLGDVFEGVQNKLGLSPVMAGIAIFGSVFYGCFFMIVALAVLVKPKLKNE